MAIGRLTIQVRLPEGAAAKLEELRQLLEVVQRLPGGIPEDLHAGVRRMVTQGAEGDFLPACGATNEFGVREIGTYEVRLVGIDELIAAARKAADRELKVDHGRSREEG